MLLPIKGGSRFFWEQSSSASLAFDTPQRAPGPDASRAGVPHFGGLMPDEKEKLILARAYELWQQAGEPQGRDEEFYHEAQRELQGFEDRGEPAKGSPDAI